MVKKRRQQKIEPDEREAMLGKARYERMLSSSSHALALTVVDRVEEIRVVKGEEQLPYRRIAARAGITARSYQNSWFGGIRRKAERGEWRPSWTTICRLATALNVDAAELVEPFK